MVCILSGLLIFLVVQIWYFYERGAAANSAFLNLTHDVLKAKQDHESLRADYDYYQNAANLEKELRARFNYRSPDETMIVIVSPKATSTPTSTLKTQ